MNILVRRAYCGTVSKTRMPTVKHVLKTPSNRVFRVNVRPNIFCVFHPPTHSPHLLTLQCPKITLSTIIAIITFTLSIFC